MIFCTINNEKDVQDVSSASPKKPKKKTSAGRKWLYFLLSVTGLYGIWLLVGGFWLPPFTRDTLQEVLREKFRTEATVEAVTFNPFTLNLVIHNVVIPNPDGNGVLFSCTALDFSPTASGALELAPGLAHAKLIEPVIDVTYFGDGRFSFSDVLDNMLAQSSEADAEGVRNGEPVTVGEDTQSTEAEPLFPFIVADFELVNGSINYRNNVLDVEHHITDINFLVPFTSTVESHKERPITPTLSAKINGSVMQVEGNTLPFTDDFSTTFTLTTDDISLSPFKKYVRDYTEVELADGSAKFVLDFGVRRLRNAEIELGFGGSLFVNNFALHSPSGETVASLQSGEVAIDTFTLAERRLSLDHVALDGLYLKACKGLNGVIDWQAWLDDAQKNFEAKNAVKNEENKATSTSEAESTATPEASSEESQVAEAEPASAFIVEGATLALTNSKIVWRDESLVGDKEIALTNIQVLVPNFNTGDGGYAAYDVKFAVNNSGLVAIAGDATMEPATATARLKIEDIPLEIAHPFLGHSLISDVQGLLGAEALIAYGTSLLAGNEVLSVAVAEDGDARTAEQADTRKLVRGEAMTSTSSTSSDIPPVIVESASVSLRNFSMGRAGNKEANPMVSFNNISLTGINVDVIKHRIEAAELALTGPAIHATLNKSNEPMVQTVAGWVKATEYGLTEQDLKEQALATKKASQNAKAEAVTASSAVASSPLKDWTAQLKAIIMTDGQIHLDMVRGKKHKVLPMGTFSGMAFKAGPITLDMAKPVDFSFETRWQKDGLFQLAGSVKPDPLDLNMTIKAKQMDLSPFDGLMAAQTNLQIAGILQTDMKCQVRIKPKTSTPLITMSGNANVQNVAFKEFGTSDNFFSLRSFDVKNFAIDSEKMKVKIGAVKVQSPYLSIKMDKYGVTNAERAAMPDVAETKYKAAKEAEKAKKAQAGKNGNDNTKGKSDELKDAVEAEADTKEIVSQPPNMVKFSSFVMDGLTISGGSSFFEDARYNPPFTLRTTAIDASCTNFSLASDSRSQVNVTAIVGGAPFAMQGTMNPVTIPPFADMTANLENMNLVPMTPYSLEFIAYPIEKGSLTAEMAVKTSEWKLDADTEFVLNNFELGNYDSRPDAPNYPVKLGLSLLRGLDGSVSIDIPVQGRLDDPNFRVGGVVVKAITNLMLRVVTSPFALLGGILSLASGDDTEDSEIVPFMAGQSTLDAVAQRRAQTMIDLLQKRPSLNVRIVGGYDEAKDGRMLCILQLLKPMKQAKYDDLSPREQVATEVDAIIIDPNEYDQFLHQRYVATKGNNTDGQEMASRQEMEEFFLKDMTCSLQEYQKLAKARALAVKMHILEVAPELKGRVFVDGDAGAPKAGFTANAHEADGNTSASQARFILQ